MYQSVDVSWPQGNYTPDAGESGVFIAATSGDGGSLFVQNTFAADVADARAVGKPVGYYHFNGAQDAAASADYFWAAIAPYYRQGDLLGLDIESYNGGTAPAQSPAWAAAFWARLAQNMGRTVASLRGLIYGNRSTMGGPGWGALEAAGLLLWLASPGGYPENTPIGEWSHWTILQYAGTGNIDRDESELSFAQIAGTPTPTRKEPEMFYIYNPTRGGGIIGPMGFYPLNPTTAEAAFALITYGTPPDNGTDIVHGTLTVAAWDNARQTAINIGDRFAAQVAAKLTAQTVDPKAIAAAVVAAIGTGAQPDATAIATAVETALTAQLSALPAAIVAAEGKALSNG